MMSLLCLLLLELLELLLQGMLLGSVNSSLRAHRDPRMHGMSGMLLLWYLRLSLIVGLRLHLRLNLSLR